MEKDSLSQRSNHTIKALSEKIGIDLPQDTFCILPFSHLSTTTTGEMRLCCRSKPIGHIKKGGLKEIWNSPSMKKARNDLLEGKKIPECQACWKAEDKGIISLRQGQVIARSIEYSDYVEKHCQQKETPLPTIELKLSNRCNLKCKMCSPAASTKWVKSWPGLQKFFDQDYAGWVDRVMNENNLQTKPNLDLYLSNPSFLEDFNEYAPDIRLMDFAGGEPLIDPIHYKILQNIIDFGNPELITLRYSTNLTVLSFEKFNVLDLWSQFKEVHLTISVDGFDKLNEYIRFGTKSEQFEKNIARIKELEQVKQIKCTTTLSAYNSLFVAETIEYVINTLGTAWHTSRVTSPNFLDARIWPQEQIEKAIEKVKKIDPNSFDLNDRQKMQLSRHINDYVLWMSSELNGKEELLNKFWNYTQASDQENKQSYESFLSLLN